MLEDELMAIVVTIKKGAESMTVREAALASSIAALNQAIAQLQQLPATLGKQTSQDIAEGVRKSIKDDFSRPIAEAVSGPVSEVHYAANEAREVLRQVRDRARLQAWNWVALMILFGIALGGFGCYLLFVREVNHLNDRLDSIQQQITPPAPVQNTKPAPTPSTKGRHARPAVAQPTAP